MATEIERKFLLRDLPNPARCCQSALIEQGWIGKLRLRAWTASVSTEYYACMKFGRGLVRSEFEYRIPSFLFIVLWPLTYGRRVLKMRHAVEVGGLTWELDMFLDRDLVLAEVELPSADYSAEPPEWLRPFIVREVTGEAAYVNSKLAK